MLEFLNDLVLLVSTSDLEKIVAPINTLCENLIPVLLGIVGSLGAVYCIFLGIKYAKADDPQEHEKAKKGLINAVLGFVIIFVLLIMLKVGLTYFTEWYQTSGS